jgi:DNA ligase-1
MRLTELVATSDEVAATSGRLEKIERLSGLLKRLGSDELEPAVAFLSGGPRQGRIGLGGRTLMDAAHVPPAAEASLEIREVDAALGDIAGARGRGSTAARAAALHSLLGRATRGEQDFLIRLIAGELRQGALEGVLLDAIARASGLPADRVRRAAMLAGTLPPVARAALVDGEPGLARFALTLFQPVQPMLADSADEIGEAMGYLGDASLEYKLDGARIQAHKLGGDVRVFSRNLRDVSTAVPEIVEAVRALPARELILDGEAIALRPDGAPQPFQITMRRFGRKLDVDRLRRDLPISPFFFDVLQADGRPLVDDPQHERFAALADLAPASLVVPHIETADPAAAEAFFERALAAGHEGVMAKSPAAAYAAGRRGQAWLKVKRARTLDLVVLAAEWGHGRRRGTLSNLHLGARDPDHGAFVMLGKTFKGLTDQMLAWQTARLLELEIGRDAYTVHVRPELVVEVAFNEIQASPQYPGGLALRFARVKRYRPDKTAAEADTIDAVRALHPA